MSVLLPGVRAFQTETFDGLRQHYHELAGGQSPKALFITCSDSRIDPCRLTNTLPGELFVVRNAGNVVPHASQPVDSVLATIEYAVEALRVPEIIVCGHSHCGAMQAVLTPEACADLPNVRAWLSESRLALGELPAQGEGAVWELVRRNVQHQLERLRSIPLVQQAVTEGRLSLHGWCYQFETGDLFVVNEEQGNISSLRPGDHA